MLDVTHAAEEFAAVLERAMGSSYAPALYSIDRAFDRVDDSHRDMLEEIEERARETREAHARRREADRSHDMRMRDLRLGDIERSSRHSERRGGEVDKAASSISDGTETEVSTLERLEERTRELLESLRDALGPEAGEENGGAIERALDRVEQLISKLEQLTEAGERFEKLVEVLNDVFERMRSGSERSGSPVDETVEAIARKLANELRSIASSLQAASAGEGDDPSTRNGGGSGAAEILKDSNRFDAVNRRILANREDGRALIAGHRGSAGDRPLAGDAARRLRDGQRIADSDRGARGSAERGNSAQLRPANAEPEGGGAADAARASERLAERLKELADLLDGNRAAEEKDGATGRFAGRVRESSRRNGPSEGELIFDVRDRRTARNDSPRQHRRGERAGGEGRGPEAREGVDRADGRSRPVHRPPRSDGEASDQRGGSERGEGVAERSSARARSEGNAAQRSNSDFQAFFDRTADRSASADRGDPSSASSGGRNLRSGAAAELARHLRESGNGDIVRQARVILRDNNLGELRLVLKPEGLGTVRMRMELEDKRIDMRIFVENSGVREVIRDNLTNLQRAFEADGFTTGEFHVDVEGDGSDGASGYERAAADSAAADSASSSARGAQEMDDAVPMLDRYDDGERHINLFV